MKTPDKHELLQLTITVLGLATAVLTLWNTLHGA